MTPETTGPVAGPHQNQPLVLGGAPLGEARVAVVLVHGRGDSADGILGLADALGVPGFGAPGIAYLAPQAAGSTWYPNSFLAPLAANEPGLSSGLRAVGDALARAEAAGIPPERIVVAGFSQGACLASEFAARHGERLGGVVALSGGLIGTAEVAGAAPPDDKRFDYAGSLDGTPVFLGCSDVDAHIPLARVTRSAEVFRTLGGAVTERIYPGMGHTVVEDELAFFRALLAGL